MGDESTGAGNNKVVVLLGSMATGVNVYSMSRQFNVLTGPCRRQFSDVYCVGRCHDPVNPDHHWRWDVISKIKKRCKKAQWVYI